MRRIAESESSQRFLDFFERTLDTFARTPPFKTVTGDSVSAGNDRDLRESEQSVAAPIGHNLSVNGNSHLSCLLRRVVQAWQRLFAEAGLTILALVSGAELCQSETSK